MNYINTITNEYPVYEVHIKARNKGFEDYAMVYNSERPQYDKITQMCVEVHPMLVGGVYFRKYEVKDKSASQIATERKALVPTQITPRQLRLQLLAIGLLDDVETLCAEDRAMSIWFEYSLDFQRSNPMVDTMALQLGLTQDDLDTIFIEANKL